ncbi:glycosyltransferase [Marivita sp. GX14005]|uniref:glycosyltransferase family protein n=1 Tax=Marivita sp. GX14005 TaxID=2942276 RepID=UPI0020193B50|nr:glycosyltransferase [Marivita sp. GX14005]MCL3881746.1 glycosyltransferase [Marivita sp. GX14005]
MHDVVCVIDPRFSGGTAAALAEDMRAFLGAGLSVGLVEVFSAYLSGGRRRSKVISDMLIDPRIEVIDTSGGTPLRARAVFLHHPMTFFFGARPEVRIDAEKCFVVAHHLPFRGDGSLQYDPVATTLRIKRMTGAWPEWLPVSGVCRSQLRSFAPCIRLAEHDWPNVFDPSEWKADRTVFSEPKLVIGRHGRPDPLKWPDTAAQISASLPSLGDTEIRVMGCPRETFREMGVCMSDWHILEFDERPVPDFLAELDVFVYHFHSTLSESFGRTVAEAMLAGAVCVLDPRLAPTFGKNNAIYCRPEETKSAIEALRGNPEKARAMARRASAMIAERHATDTVAARLERLLAAGRKRSAEPERAVSPMVAARKVVGMIRRGEYFPRSGPTRN